jgi:thiosulfate/3-mercaptopyruvate sulfurtransferase
MFTVIERSNRNKMSEKILYSLEEVIELISTDSAVLIDSGDAESFQVDHIAGAVNIPEIKSFLAKSTPGGLAEMKEKFQDLFSKAGVSKDKTAILYEDGWDSQCRSTCRGYWLLKYLGHPNVGILDCGFIVWLNEDLPSEEGLACPKPVEFLVNPNEDIIATKDDVLKAIDDPSIVLLDTREEPEWNGEISTPGGYEPLLRKGRLPGARWIKWHKFIEESREALIFKTKEETCKICAIHDIFPEDEIIIYCFKGRRASSAYIALKQAGFTRVKVYFASWNEWARYPDLPIEQGAQRYRKRIADLAIERAIILNNPVIGGKIIQQARAR